MSEKRFTWLSSTQYPRRGPVLECGKEYAIADFNAGAVAVWVEQGDAAYVYKKEKKGASLKEE